MTIGQHVAVLRGLIRQHTDSEVPFTDEFLYTLFRTSANYLIRQKFDKYNKMPQWNVEYYCIGMEPDYVHDCDCIGAGCLVMKTKFKIPKPMQGKFRDYVRVMTLDHRDIGYVHPSSASVVNFDPVRKGALHFSFVNKHIVLWNSDVERQRPKAILIGGYFEDPSEWAGIDICDNDGNPTGVACFDIQTSDYPVDTDLVDGAYNMVLDKLRLPLAIPADNLNDTV
jgi:hypothetical protein